MEVTFYINNSQKTVTAAEEQWKTSGREQLSEAGIKYMRKIYWKYTGCQRAHWNVCLLRKPKQKTAECPDEDISEKGLYRGKEKSFFLSWKANDEQK